MENTDSHVEFRNSQINEKALKKYAEACAETITLHLKCDVITMLALDVGNWKAYRFFTSASNLFPLSGEKPIPSGRWAKEIIEAQKAVIFSGVSEIKDIFSDHDYILSNGFQTVLNIPVIQGTKCVASINCLFQSDMVSLPNAEDIFLVQTDFRDSGLVDLISPSY